jgi:hypothetical protein
MVALARYPHTILQKISSYVQKNYACFVREPDLFLMRKLARFESFRQIHRFLYGVKSAPESTQLTSVLGNVDVDTVANQIRTEGCYEGLQLSTDLVQDLLTFASTAPCYGNRNPNLPFYVVDQKALAARLEQPLILASYMGSIGNCRTLFRRTASLRR